MQRILKYTLIIFVILITSKISIAQLDAVMKGCEQHLTNEYMSDGQQYISMLTGEQIAEFNVIFYGGSTYRIISCANNNQTINFTVFDKNRNKLFNSSEQNNTHYWDFQFESTIECFIEASLVSDESNISGFAILLVGIKQ